MTKDKADTRNLVIEWRHLEVGGETCDRCSGTYANILEAITSLEKSGELKGFTIEVIDTPLTEDRIRESNLVLINGVPIEELAGAGVEYTECTSCTDLVGAPSCCRAVTREGGIAEALPVDMIRAAIRVVVNSMVGSTGP